MVATLDGPCTRTYVTNSSSAVVRRVVQEDVNEFKPIWPALDYPAVAGIVTAVNDRITCVLSDYLTKIVEC